MGADVFIQYACPYRKDGDPNLLHNLLRLERLAFAMERGQIRGNTVKVQIREGLQVREQVYTQADLKMATSKLNEVYATCAQCPANLKKAFGLHNAVGCQAYISAPMDDFAERILHETLTENAKPDRCSTEQSNLIRALIASTPNRGDRWRQIGNGEHTRWGTRAVVFSFDGRSFEVTVHALCELLFAFEPGMPPMAIDDILSFFRSFFAVVAAYVSTPNGELDEQRNRQFWSRSPALNELNLYIQLLKHAQRNGAGAVSATAPG
ncbi:MAG: hypothetical protein KC561_05635 [Myxococcales bacterium]|nr:hypothetical protein [Myxococcales bacterium]